MSECSCVPCSACASAAAWPDARATRAHHRHARARACVLPPPSPSMSPSLMAWVSNEPAATALVVSSVKLPEPSLMNTRLAPSLPSTRSRSAHESGGAREARSRQTAHACLVARAPLQQPGPTHAQHPRIRHARACMCALTAVAVEVAQFDGVGVVRASSHRARRALSEAARAVVDEHAIGGALVALDEVEVCAREWRGA